jgi:Pyruvate/2-oxoacid:ferredoxin oxidoreductase delta subunit
MADQVIVAIGQEPDLSCLAAGSPELARTDDGRLWVDPATGATSHRAIFVGGDLGPGERTVTGAIASGQRAAWAVDRMLRGPEMADRRPPPRLPSPPVGHSAAAPTNPWFRAPRVPRPERSETSRVDDFAEVAGRLSEAQARAEASRCLLCGACGNCRACLDLFACPALAEPDGRVVIDPGLCTGCAVCAQVCANDAIRMVPRA